MIKGIMSKERKQYLKEKRNNRYLVLLTQILILVLFLGVWEYLANKNIIDSFITSKPSRIVATLINLGANDLTTHISVTVYETLVGFLLGAFLGMIIAIILWWSDFLAKVADPYLVVLNSLPKVALRTSYYYLGWSWYSRNYCNGSCYLINCYYFRKPKWVLKNG